MKISKKLVVQLLISLPFLIGQFVIAQPESKKKQYGRIFVRTYSNCLKIETAFSAEVISSVRKRRKADTLHILVKTSALPSSFGKARTGDLVVEIPDDVSRVMLDKENVVIWDRKVDSKDSKVTNNE